MNYLILKRVKSILSTVTFIVTFFLPCLAYSSQVTLTWEKPDDNRVAGYSLYCGISGTDFKAMSYETINSPDTVSYIFSDLEEGFEYSFAATSFDSDGNESDFSETINYFIGSPSGSDVDDDGDCYTENEGDSSDSDATIFPGAIEICGDGIDQDCDGSDLECIPDETQEFVLEIGEVEINHNWEFVAFTKTYVHPVVVARTASLNGGDPGVVRVKNVSPNGFEVRFQEWDYRDGWHLYETVGYMVMEAGHHVLPNGIHVEAGTFESSRTKKTVSFEGEFNQIPVVISGVITENELDAVTGRLSNISLNAFDIVLQEQEANKYGHYTVEKVSYIAWEPSSGEVDGMNYIVDSTFDEVTHAFYYIPFYPLFENAPVFVADMQTTDGGNSCNVRWQNKDGEGIEVQIDEDQSGDSEVSHTTEVVGFMAFGSAP